MTSPPSIRSNMSSRRPTIAVARKSTTNPSVSIIFADTEQSSPHRGAAAAGLEPKIIAHDKEMRKREREDGLSTSGSGEVRSDALSVNEDASNPDGLPARSQRARRNSLMSLLSFRRSPSKQSLKTPESRPTRSALFGPAASNVGASSVNVIAVPLSESPKESMSLDIEGLPRTSSASFKVSAQPPAFNKPDGSGNDAKSMHSTRSASRGWFGSLSRKPQSIPDEKHEAAAAAAADSRASPPVCLDEGEPLSQAHAADTPLSSSPTSSGSEVYMASTPTIPLVSVSDPPKSSGSIWFAPQRISPQPSAPPLDRVPSGPSSLDVKTPIQQDFSSGLDEGDSAKAMPEMEVISSRSGETGRLSDLNPSTSRFTLSMPLLGRPKIPLEDVIAQSGVNVAVATNSSLGEGKVSSVEKEVDASATGASTKTVEPTDESTSTEIDVSSLGNHNGNTAVKHLPFSTNWWSYVGFGGTERPQSIDNPSSEESPAVTKTVIGEDAQTLSTTTNSAIQSQSSEPELKTNDVYPSSLVEPVATAAINRTIEDSDLISDVPKAQPVVLSDLGAGIEPLRSASDVDERWFDKPKSLTSTQAAWQAYSPWAFYDWYTSPVPASSTATSELPTEAPVADASSGDEENSSKPMTEAEKIKHEALARPDGPVTTTAKRSAADVDPAMSSGDGPGKRQETSTDNTLGPKDTQRTEHDLDPASQKSVSDSVMTLQERALTSSLVVNAKGWVSFFSSSRSLSIATTRGLAEKSEADKSRENSDGMEVMEIDEPLETKKAKSAPASIPLSPSLKSTSRASSKAPSINVSGPSSLRKDYDPNGNENSASDGIFHEKSTMKDGPLTVSQEPKHKASIISALASSPHAASSISNAKTKAKREVSPSPSLSSKRSNKSSVPTPTSQPKPPNLILPTFDDTFKTAPRSSPPITYVNRAEREREEAKGSGGISAKSRIRRTIGLMSNVLFARDVTASHQRSSSPPSSPQSGTRRRSSSLLNPHSAAREERGDVHVREDLSRFGEQLPRAWEVLGENPNSFVGERCKRVVIIGVHGWFPGNAMRAVVGEPTGTSAKFANMMALAVEEFVEKHGLHFDEVTQIPLEGEGKIGVRCEKLYRNLTSNKEWMTALRAADAIFVATHSQGSIVSTHLIHRLLEDGHIRTGLHHGHLHQEHDESGSSDAVAEAFTSVQAAIASGAGGVIEPKEICVDRREQRVCCLAMCGIHLGPLAYLQKNSFLMPYIQWFESEAAAELFEFQNTESQVSKAYISTLRDVLDHGIKFVYIASMNDQVVPIYSGAFSAVSHPLIVRALYIDGDAYHSSDFLSNLLVLLMRIRNAGLPDGGLLAHLSEATAGSLNGVGHSTAYEELATFSLAVDYLFLVDNGMGGPHDLSFEPFNALDQLNDYEIPWSLRDLIADERVLALFSKEFIELRDAFGDWHPRTTILRDLKRKLEPIKRLKLSSNPPNQTSKL